jgi:hypothetical protein
MRLYNGLPLPFAAANAYHDLTQPPQTREHIAGVTLEPVQIPRNHVTLETDPQTAEIHITRGLAPMTADLDQMDTIAHETWHGHTYLDGTTSPERILTEEYPRYGYANAPSELAAKAFANRVKANYQSGRCR